MANKYYLPKDWGILQTNVAPPSVSTKVTPSYPGLVPPWDVLRGTWEMQRGKMVPYKPPEVRQFWGNQPIPPEPLEKPLRAISGTLEQAATQPLFRIGGVGISSSDMIALGLLGYGVYEIGSRGVQVLQKLLSNRAINNEFMKSPFAQQYKGQPEWNRIKNELFRAFMFDKSGNKETSERIITEINRSFGKQGVAKGAELALYNPELAKGKPSVIEKIAEPGRQLPMGQTTTPVVRMQTGQGPITELPHPTWGITYMPPSLDVASNAQKVVAHQIAFAKGFGDAFRRRVAKIYTGKRSMLEMTEDEASIFIQALESLPKTGTVIKGGKKVKRHPIIPTTKAVVPEDYFNIKYKEPTVQKYITAQDYYAHQLGVGSLIDPLRFAKEDADFEITTLRNAVTKKISELNKLGGETWETKGKAVIKNVPTKAVSSMRDLLNKYEEPPAFLSDKEREIFTWFRNLNRTMLNAENQVRALVGEDPIPYRKAYVRHVAEGLAWDILQGVSPLPEELKYWSRRLVSKTITNPMALQRQLSADLEAYFTKDLEYATNSMIYTAVRAIHLSQPLRAFTDRLAAQSKDMALYENLSPEQFRELKHVRVMPASTRKWAEDYVNQVIKGQPTDIDLEVNRLLANEGLRAVVNKFLMPFGRSLGRFPVTTMGQVSGRLILMGVMGPVRPRMLIRNVFQLVQNLALYSVEANIKGIVMPVTPEMKQLMEASKFLQGYTGLEDAPSNLYEKFERLYHGAYRWTAQYTAFTTEKVAYWGVLPLFTNPKYKSLGWGEPQRTYKEPKGFLYPSEKEKMLQEMEWGTAATQFSYIAQDMPEVFRHKSLIPLTRLQSWWMNYFTRFIRESVYRGFTGKTGYGAKIPWGMRLGFLKYAILGGLILYKMGYQSSFLLGVLPTYMSPPVQLAMGLYNFAIADTPAQRENAVKHIKQSFTAFIPGSLTWKDFNDVWSGKKPLSSLILYGVEDIKPSEGLPDIDWQNMPGGVPNGEGNANAPEELKGIDWENIPK